MVLRRRARRTEKLYIIWKTLTRFLLSLVWSHHHSVLWRAALEGNGDATVEKEELMTAVAAEKKKKKEKKEETEEEEVEVV